MLDDPRMVIVLLVCLISLYSFGLGLFCGFVAPSKRSCKCNCSCKCNNCSQSLGNPPQAE